VLSAYAALAGLEAHVFMLVDVSLPFVAECRALGAQVTLVAGLITNCGKQPVREGRERGWFDLSTVKEPTVWRVKRRWATNWLSSLLEAARSAHLPQRGGTSLIGMWKALDEMEQLGWIGPEQPRMVTVQSDGCAPMAEAFHEGQEFADPWPDAMTLANVLRVPSAVGGFLILRARGRAAASP
jgi:threonine synthase